MYEYLRSRKAERILTSIMKLREDSEDYFDDELTLQLRAVEGLLKQALIQIRYHELDRLRALRMLRAVGYAQLKSSLVKPRRR